MKVRSKAMPTNTLEDAVDMDGFSVRFSRNDVKSDGYSATLPEDMVGVVRDWIKRETDQRRRRVATAKADYELIEDDAVPSADRRLQPVDHVLAAYLKLTAPEQSAFVKRAFDSLKRFIQVEAPPAPAPVPDELKVTLPVPAPAPEAPADPYPDFEAAVALLREKGATKAPAAKKHLAEAKLTVPTDAQVKEILAAASV